MAKIRVFFNNKASGTSKGNWKEGLQKYFFRHDIKFLYPKSLQELKSSIKNLDNDTILFIVGGDGTINSVLSELVEKDLKIVIVPTGTANDLAGELRLTANISKIVKAFQYNTLREVDVLKVNNNFFITVGGIGLANNVVGQINNLRNNYPIFKDVMSVLSAHVYALFLAKELAFKKLTQFRLKISYEINGKLINKKINPTMVYINNQPMLGGSFNIAPNTKNDDAKFCVTILTHLDKLSLIKAILLIRSGKLPLNDPNFIQFETEKLVIESKIKLLFFGDGEELAKSNTLEISVSSKKLKFICLTKDYTYEHSYSLDEIQKV